MEELNGTQPAEYHHYQKQDHQIHANLEKISQPDAARATGCTPQAIGQYENDRMDVSDNRLRCLLALYDFTFDEFSEYLSGKPIPMVNVKDECLQLLDQI